MFTNSDLYLDFLRKLGVFPNNMWIVPVYGISNFAYKTTQVSHFITDMLLLVYLTFKVRKYICPTKNLIIILSTTQLRFVLINLEKRRHSEQRVCQLILFIYFFFFQRRLYYFLCGRTILVFTSTSNVYIKNL